MRLRYLRLANCAPPRVPTQIEGNWLWKFLNWEDRQVRLIIHAEAIANLADTEKQLLLDWMRVVADLASQFESASKAQWPTEPPRIDKKAWKAFKTLMQAFYMKAFKSGLPYLSNGDVTESGGVDYAHFVKEFRATHCIDPNPHAREACVLCGFHLLDVEVDHWVSKGAFPLLSICAQNLLPICRTCNSPENKGDKPVHSSGNFIDWFHPYFRPPNGSFKLEFDSVKTLVTMNATTPIEEARARNLDILLQLERRWTDEFKAERRKLVKKFIQSRSNKQGPNTVPELRAALLAHQQGLLPSEPNYEVHEVLFRELLDDVRLPNFYIEIASDSVPSSQTATGS